MARANSVSLNGSFTADQGLFKIAGPARPGPARPRPRQAVGWILDLTRAVAFLHSCQIIHRCD